MAVWITDAAGKRVCVTRDGKDGTNGANATINGVNTLEIKAGDNVTITQDGNVMTISATGGGTLIEVPIPSQNGELVYTGGVQSPSWNDYSPTLVELSGETSGTDAGVYTVTATLKNENSFWDDDTRMPKQIQWRIGKATAQMPAVSGSLVYTGQAQSPVLTGYVADSLTKGGDTSATDAGDYNMSVTPTSNYQWGDGTSETRDIPWSIGQAASSISLDKTSVDLNRYVTTAVVNVSGDGDGTLSAVSSHPEIATAKVNGNQITITGIDEGSATITVKRAASQNYTAAADRTISVTSTIGENQIFGIMKDRNNTQSPAFTRLNASNDPNHLVNTNITFEPAPALGTGSGSSPFNTFYPWNKMEEWNVVDGNITVKMGQSGFSRTANDVVVFIPEFWIKVVDDASSKKRYYYISQRAVSGFTKHPGSGRCVGKYNTGAGYVSKSGLAPLNGIKRSAARNGHKGRGAKFNNYDFASWCAIQWLYLVEFGNFHSQAEVGHGCVDKLSAPINSGGCDAMTYHTGRAAGTDGKTAVMYRWIENPWGNVWDWVDGANFSERKCYVCTDPSKFADDTATGYTDTGLTLPSSNGFVLDYGYSDNAPWALIPITGGGSETTGSCDYVFSNAGWRVLFVGGYRDSAGKAGLFCVDAADTSSTSYSSCGARQLYLPTADEIVKMAT